MTKSTERKIIFALMAVLLAAICTSAAVTIAVSYTPPTLPTSALIEIPGCPVTI